MSKSRGVSSYTHTKQQRDHYANQYNFNNIECKVNKDNHSNQCNPNNAKYQKKTNYKK